MPDEHIDPGHGNTVAAWTAVLVMLVSIGAGTVFFYLDQPLYVWICAAVTAGGLVLGGLLKLVGLGKKRPAAKSE
ncbi:DUF6704 family protein [uncultured Agrococcus sp.]|uniref:DUF6704 family protein n=1 Tax=uncultured Agrococcus sp. TaxID=382258 RepID=UPI0025F0F6EB|nr:DUF6704 family protein [uncultured Agrococcus sp.]